MLGNERFTRGTVNEALSRGFSLGRQFVRAQGFQPLHAVSDDTLIRLSKQWGVTVSRPEKFNGGLHSIRMGRLEANDILFRFSDSRITGDARYSGLWWFDLEALKTIRWAAMSQNSGFSATARTLLGVLPEWGDMANLVGAKLMKDFWCFKGLTGAVKGKDYSMSGPVRTDIVQLYVPGGLAVDYLADRHSDVLKSGIV